MSPLIENNGRTKDKNQVLSISRNKGSASVKTQIGSNKIDNLAFVPNRGSASVQNNDLDDKVFSTQTIGQEFVQNAGLSILHNKGQPIITNVGQFVLNGDDQSSVGKQNFQNKLPLLPNIQNEGRVQLNQNKIVPNAENDAFSIEQSTEPLLLQNNGLPINVTKNELLLSGQSIGLPIAGQNNGILITDKNNRLPMPIQSDGIPIINQNTGLPNPPTGLNTQLPITFKNEGLPILVNNEGLPVVQDLDSPAGHNLRTSDHPLLADLGLNHVHDIPRTDVLDPDSPEVAVVDLERPGGPIGLKQRPEAGRDLTFRKDVN